jgi:hypothetical protein
MKKFLLLVVLTLGAFAGAAVFLPAVSSQAEAGKRGGAKRASTRAKSPRVSRGWNWGGRPRGGPTKQPRHHRYTPPSVNKKG